MELLYLLTLLSLFILMVICLEFLQKKKIAQGETTRKMGHLILGCILIMQPCIFSNIAFPIILSLIISIIIYISSIKNKLSCADNVTRKTHGTYLYPIGILITLLFSYIINRVDLFYQASLILIISDIASAIIGKYSMNKKLKYGHKINNKIFTLFHKTIYGSIAFFVFTAIILTLFYSDNIVLILSVSLLVTIVEFVSTKGFDNLTIPISALAFLYLSTQ